MVDTRGRAVERGGGKGACPSSFLNITLYEQFTIHTQHKRRKSLAQHAAKQADSERRKWQGSKEQQRSSRSRKGRGSEGGAQKMKLHKVVRAKKLTISFLRRTVASAARIVFYWSWPFCSYKYPGNSDEFSGGYRLFNKKRPIYFLLLQ